MDIADLKNGASEQRKALMLGFRFQARMSIGIEN
jgi:hypothetical protein